MDKRDKYFLSFMIFSFIFYLINVYYQSKQEMLQSYNFVVTKINIYPSTSITLDSKDRCYSFWNFTPTIDDSIKVGDRLEKPKCSNKIYFFRKDSLGKEVLIKTIRLSNGLLQYECE